LDFYLNEGAQSHFWGRRFVQLVEQFPEARNAKVDNGAANFILGFEVVVDIAQRNPGLLGDICDSRRAEPVLVGDFFGGLKEPRAVVCFHFWHCGVSYSQLTDCMSYRGTRSGQWPRRINS